MADNASVQTGDRPAAEPAGLYRYERSADSVDTLASIGPGQVRAFGQQGYLAVGQAFGAEAVGLALAAVEDLIAGRVPGFEGVQFEAGTTAEADLSLEDKRDRVRKLWRFCGHAPHLRVLAEDGALRAAVSLLMGGAAPEMFQDQALLKPPHGGREKPWHQDNAYFNLPPLTPVVGVWIALDPAGPDNGCMHVIPGSHRQGPVVHFHRRDWQICDTDVAVARDVMVPLPPGGCLFFHGLLHHGTPTNQSSRRRRAVQFHYRPEGTPTTRGEDRLATFGSEGKDVTC